MRPGPFRLVLKKLLVELGQRQMRRSTPRLGHAKQALTQDGRLQVDRRQALLMPAFPFVVYLGVVISRRRISGLVRLFAAAFNTERGQHFVEGEDSQPLRLNCPATSVAMIGGLGGA